MDADGGSQRRLTEKSIPTSRKGVRITVLQVAPRWSPDGQAIGYIAPAEGGLAFRVVDPLTGKAVQSTLSGALISFGWYQDSRHVIYTRMSPDGSGEREMLVAVWTLERKRRCTAGPTQRLPWHATEAGLCRFSQNGRADAPR